MNKFLIYDKELEIYRLPLSYSLGDLDRIRNMFGEHSLDASIALPQLPPQRDILDASGKLGYLTYLPFDLDSKLTDYLEKTVVHVRELKGKGYDYQNPLFKSYLSTREETVAYLAEKLDAVISQERRLGIFNVLILALTKQLVACLEDILVRSSGSQKLRYMVHPHVKSMLNQVLEMVYEKLEYRDNITRQDVPFHRGTLKSKLGSNFNFNFVNDVLNVQISLLESSISPLDPQYQIRKILVDENSEYFITYEDFLSFYSSAKEWIERRIYENDEWIFYMLSNILGIPESKIPKLNINSVVFDPQIMFTIQESLKSIPVHSNSRGLPLRRKTLVDEIGSKIWNQVLLDYVKLCRELQKAEIISFFRDRILILGPEYRQKSPNDEFAGLKDRITYNFDKGTIISDLRQLTMMFIDLRGFTEISSGLIPVRKLKNALYTIFDPALDIIDHFKGQIRFFAGDAIMVTFSQGKRQEQTMNAVRSAVIFQKTLRKLAKKENLPFEGAGIGIHVGKIENAYIFKNFQEKIDTVIGLPTNVTSRLSSGKSVAEERKGDPAFIRELQDTLQDVLERVKGKVQSSLRQDLVEIFEQKLRRYSGEGHDSDVYLPLKEIKRRPGNFKVTIIGGVLDNNGIALSEEAFQEIRKYHKLISRPKGDNIEFILQDDEFGANLVFSRIGDAVLKGIDKPIAVWSIKPEKERFDAKKS